MNYNANSAARQPGMSRKPKRVVDTNAMGAPAPMSNPYMQPTIDQQSNNMMGGNHHVPQSSAAPQMGGFTDNPANNSYGYSDFGGPQQHQQQQPQHSGQIGGRGPGGGGFPQHQQQQPAGPNFPGQFAMFQQPIVQDMALQYGQRLADQGKEQLEKYIPVTRLKYYFAVDNKYVINKLRLLFFPYTHRDWSLKYDQDNPVQPRYDINAPDLYIPVMAYITYVVLAGLVLGMQDRFSPEQLGIQASSALAYAIMELIVYSLTLYIGNIQTMLKTLDLMAFAGYKFVIINVCLVTSILFKSFGYYLCLLYSSVALGFFLLRTIKAKVLSESTQSTAAAAPPGYDMYGQPTGAGQQYDHRTGHKRKVYFLLLISGLQPVLSFWLSYHLMPKSVVAG